MTPPTIGATKRLNKEYKQMREDPTPFIVARPRDDNILEWHYIITGPPQTPYAGGQYHGILVFPHDYPFRPPGIKMVTPSGRFRPNTRLCLSISDYHPESWNPAWTVDTILTGLMSFMVSNDNTTGSVTSSESEKKKLASVSRKWNASNNKAFTTVFSDYIDGVTMSEVKTTDKDASESTSRPTTQDGGAAVRPVDGKPLTAQATPEHEKHKRKHSTEKLELDKKAKAQGVVNLDTEEVVNLDSDDDDGVLETAGDPDDDFYEDYDPFSSDEGEVSDFEGNQVIVLD